MTLSSLISRVEEGSDVASASVRPVLSRVDAVAVKPLKWVVSTWHGTVVFKAKSIVGEYMVAPKAWGPGWLWRLDLHWEDTYYSVADEDEGKAGAQADYEARIRSALEDSKASLADATKKDRP